MNMYPTPLRPFLYDGDPGHYTGSRPPRTSGPPFVPYCHPDFSYLLRTSCSSLSTPGLSLTVFVDLRRVSSDGLGSS